MARYKEKPKTEVMLTEIQERYLQTRNVEDYQALFSEILPYSKSLILKKTTGKVYLPPDLVDNAALEATVKFMVQYEKPDFKVQSSFGGVLSFKVLEALYGPKTIAADQIASLNDHIESNKSEDTELGDMPESFNFTYLFRPDGMSIGEDPANYLFSKESDCIDSIMSVIDDLYMSSDLHTFFNVILGSILFVKRNKRYEEYRDHYLSNNMKEVLDLTLLEVRNRLITVA